MKSFLRWIAGWACLAALVARAVDPFPIMAWNTMPDDPALFARLKECGFTVAGFVPKSALDHVHAAGLKALVSDPRASGYRWTAVDAAAAREKVMALVRETASHPAVLGYYLVDEPGADSFAGLGVVSGLIRELAPKQCAYVNLFPNYATAAQLGTPDYATYLDRFATECRPTVLSYDHYAVMEDGTLGGRFFKNLEEMRAAARRRNLPFWNIVLSVGCVGYRVPSDADLRFQAYSTLAYGASGLTWFTYLTPHVGNFREAPEDQFGHRTPAWARLQNVNLQVLQLAPVYVKLRHDDTYHFAPVPDGAHGARPESLLQDVGAANVFAADFTHEDGSRYLMIVNRDLQRSGFLGRLKFAGETNRVEQVSPWTGQLHDFSGEHQWVAPGAGVLLRVGPQR